MKRHFVTVLFATGWFVITSGFTNYMLYAEAEKKHDAKIEDMKEMETEWDKIDRFSVETVRNFIARFPKEKIPKEILDRSELMNTMEAIESGKASSVVIPFSSLAPWVEKWAKENTEKTVILYVAKKEGKNTVYRVGTTLAEPGAQTIMRRGFMCPPMGRGTIVAFRTNGLKFQWPEGGTIVSEGNSTLYFGILPKKAGLVLLKGKGNFITNDNKTIRLGGK